MAAVGQAAVKPAKTVTGAVGLECLQLSGAWAQESWLARSWRKSFDLVGTFTALTVFIVAQAKATAIVAQAKATAME